MDDAECARTIIRRIFIAQVAVLATGVAIVIVLSIYTGEAGTFLFAFLLGSLGGSVSLFSTLAQTDLRELAPAQQKLDIDTCANALWRRHGDRRLPIIHGPNSDRGWRNRPSLRAGRYF